MVSNTGMTRIVIQNTTVLTLDERDTFHYPGFIEIRNDKIFRIGDWSPDTLLDEYDRETIMIDGTDKLVMPGLVDLHFHTSVAKVDILFDLFEEETDTITGLWRQVASLGIPRPNMVSIHSGSDARNMSYRSITFVYHGVEVWYHDGERYVPPLGLPCERCTADWYSSRDQQ
jgi:formylmethanofuran dehydrogenase subunit A